MVNNTLIAHLLDKELYDHDIASFRVIETHTSYIILTGSYAYKIKKSIKFDFLDYSTLEQRLHYCERELTLNQQTAPEIYLAVIAIYGSAEQPCFQPPQPDAAPIEWAVKMREFPQHMLLSQLIQGDTLNTQHFIDLAERVAHFHQSAEPCLTAAYGNADNIHIPIHSNFATIHAHLAQCHSVAPDESTRKRLTEAEQIINAMTKLTENLYQKHRPVFELRKKNGFIRACHGDLHLNNILLLHNHPTMFDCIEFNESFRWIDVCAEIAFLTMDLRDHHRPDFANIFLNYYLEYTGDYGCLQILPYYQSYRAMVRAKIAVLTALARPEDPVWIQQHLNQFFHYLNLAHCFITEKRLPFMVLMHGLSGSGKSFLSSQLMTHPGLIRIRSDVERKRLLQIPTHQPIPEHLKKSAYQPTHNQKTFDHLHKLATIIIEASYAVLIDATFLRHLYRQMFIRLAEHYSISWRIIATVAPHAFLVDMLRNRKNQRNEPSDATERVINMQEDLLEPLTAQEKMHSIILDSSHIDWCAEKILLLVAELIRQLPSNSKEIKQSNEHH